MFAGRGSGTHGALWQVRRDSCPQHKLRFQMHANADAELVSVAWKAEADMPVDREVRVVGESDAMYIRRG